LVVAVRAVTEMVLVLAVVVLAVFVLEHFQPPRLLPARTLFKSVVVVLPVQHHKQHTQLQVHHLILGRLLLRRVVLVAVVRH
jgi:hypothetical protein